MFRPKLFSALKGYTKGQFRNDLTAGIIVGIVALPLAIAFAIASGVSPEKGLYTAIVAGFIISAFGGSSVQIGGPTGAFIIVVYDIIQQYGIEGLTIATMMAGVMLMIMGFLKLGSLIRFVSHSLIVGFTTGIAVIIFSSQIRDFLGLEMENVPYEFTDKWKSYFSHLHSIDPFAVFISLGTIILIIGFSKITSKIPGSLIAIILFSLAASLFKWPVDTIGSRYGEIPSSLPMPVIPHLDFKIMQSLIRPALVIAVLGGIESLLSAVVSDGMIGGKHRSNTELIAQGGANVFSAIFGGIPATGAIARTATNVKNGGRTPVAGIIHTITLLIIMVFAGKWATLISMSCLAGILLVVAYNMSEWRSFISILKGPKDDAIILLVTFILTVISDLTVAIEVGMILSAFMFMRRMALSTRMNAITTGLEVEIEKNDDELRKYKIMDGVEVYELEGPFFFGAVSKFTEAINLIDKPPRVLIIDMQKVPFVDGSGIHALKRIFSEYEVRRSHLVLSGVRFEVYSELNKTGLLTDIGKENIRPDIKNALRRAEEIIEKNQAVV